MAQLRELIAAGKSKFLGTSTFQGMLIVDNKMSIPGISSANTADYFLAKNSNDEVIYINKNNISVGTANALSTQNVGSNVKIIYWKDGVPVLSNGDVGGAAHPIYLKNGELTACSSDIGNGKQPVFMNAGVITPSAATEGSTSCPLYLKSGVLTPITQLAVANGGTGKASWTKFALVYASNTTELDSLGLGTAGYILTSNGSTAKPSWTAPTTLLSNALAITASGMAPLTLAATPTTTNGKTTVAITGSIATATATSAGITVVYPAASCTSYTSDSGAVTPAAAKKAVTLFTNDYAPTKTGGGASGTWDISITGSAGGLNSNVSAIELNSGGTLASYGGFIDFHFHDANKKPTNASGTVVSTTPDYTSRIIENAAGQIAINGVTIKGSTITGTLSGNASSAAGFTSAKTITLTGNVTGSASGGNGSNGWSISTTVASVPNGALPLRLCNYQSSGFGTANEAIETGFHYITGASDTNRPAFRQSSNKDYRILTTAYSDIWLQQIATDFRCDDLFLRRKENSSWKPWVQILTTGGMNGRSSSWWNGRDNALLRQITANGYSPAISIKTTSGSWEIGHYNADNWHEQLLFNYKSDTSYAKGNNDNTVIHALKLLNNGYMLLGNKVYMGPNDVSDYGSLRVYGDAVGGYEGIHFGSGKNGMTIMSIDGSHQGLYNNAASKWILYYPGSGGCVGIGTSSLDTNYHVTQGSTSITGALYMNNCTISGVNDLSFADPGANEGISWAGGNKWSIYESPDNLTNGKGNLQFVHDSTRRLTIRTDGYIDANAHLLANNGLTWTDAYWTAPGNIICNKNDTNAEFSFDMGAETQWHVWSTPNGTSMLSCFSDNKYVQVHHHLQVGNYNNSSYALTTDSFICNSWIRTIGDTGWCNESYGGGWYMTDTTYIRAYNDKQVYVSNAGQHAIYAAGGFASAKTEGAVFSTYYNGTWYETLRTHGNGNLTVDAPGGSLYLAYYRGNTYFAGGTYYIDRAGYFNGKSNYTNYLASHNSAVTTSSSSWDGAVSGHTVAWRESFKATNISTDTGDLVLGLRASQYSSGGTELCMMIDGDYYAMGNKVLHAGNYTSWTDERYVNVTGDTMTGNLYVKPAASNAEKQIGMAFGKAANSSTFYIWGNTTTGTRGIYDSVLGYVIQGNNGATQFLHHGTLVTKSAQSYGTAAQRDAVASPATGQVFFVLV